MHFIYHGFYSLMSTIMIYYYIQDLHEIYIKNLSYMLHKYSCGHPVGDIIIVLTLPFDTDVYRIDKYFKLQITANIDV